jgi:hypothetical protein
MLQPVGHESSLQRVHLLESVHGLAVEVRDDVHGAVVRPPRSGIHKALRNLLLQQQTCGTTWQESCCQRFTLSHRLLMQTDKRPALRCGCACMHACILKTAGNCSLQLSPEAAVLMQNACSSVTMQQLLLKQCPDRQQLPQLCPASAPACRELQQQLCADIYCLSDQYNMPCRNVLSALPVTDSKQVHASLGEPSYSLGS